MILMNQKHNSNWIDELDYLRAFAILAVISIHTTANFTRIENLNLLAITNIIIDVFSHFAVPIFVIISGIALSFNYYKNVNYKKFYLRRFKSIIPQYIIFSSIYLMFRIFVEHSKLSILFVIYSFFSGSAMYHLWFIIMILQFYLFYPLLIKIYEYFEKRNRINIIMFLSLAVQVVFNIIILVIEDYLGSSTIEIIIGDIIKRTIFISYIFYFTIGIIIGRNLSFYRKYLINIKNKTIFSIIIISLLIISLFWIYGILIYGNFYSIANTFFTIPRAIEIFFYLSVFILLWKISTTTGALSNNRIRYLLKDYGKLSFGIYLIHVLILTGVIMIISKWNITYLDWSFYPITYISTVIFSYFITLSISYIPHSSIIIGFSKKIRAGKE